jgi:hypothetical protein
MHRLLNNLSENYLCSSVAAASAGAASVVAAESVDIAEESVAAGASTAVAVESAAGAASSVLEDEHEVANVIAATAKVTLNKFFILFFIIINNIPLILFGDSK